jgi:hypothetical protein
MPKASKLLMGCGSIIGGLILLLVVLAIVFTAAIDTGHIPDSAALPKGKIPARLLTKLREWGVIEPGEEVQFFYSCAFFSLKADGNLFTDKRVILYQEIDGEMEIYSAHYPEIDSITFHESESWTEDSSITITLNDGDWFLLIVSADGGRDVVFEQKLRDMWQRNRGESQDTPSTGTAVTNPPSP